MQDKSIYEYPHLIAVLIVMIGVMGLGLGTGIILAAWYSACLFHQCRSALEN